MKELIYALPLALGLYLAAMHFGLVNAEFSVTVEGNKVIQIGEYHE